MLKQLNQTFPRPIKPIVKTKKGDKTKMGQISFASVRGGEYQLIVVNGYTQFHWSGGGVLADYEAIRSVMKHVKSKFSGKRIGYPKIGAGLAKGDWSIISQIIEQELAGEDHTLVDYKPPL